MSTSASTSINQDLVLSVIEVTGATQAEAEHLLAACDNNVEAAVELYLEQGAAEELSANDVDAAGPSKAANPTPRSLEPNCFDDDTVRAPIAPICEQLIGPEDDNFTAAPSLPSRITRAAPRVKVCPFRDFAREGALMEDELQVAAMALETNDNTISPSNGHDSNARSARATTMISMAMEQRKSRLDDLFRPPTDIACAGTFQTARLRATELQHWLLVNLQSDNFDSQVLNRDVWSDKEVRKLIRRKFMLWQVDKDTSEGRRFVAFYHCAKLPYICVIDPRTGEEVWRSAEPKQTNVLLDLQSFLREHKDFSEEISDNGPTTSKRSTECITVDDDGDVSVECNHKKRAKLVELTEEEQIALAIRNSLRENGQQKGQTVDNNGDDDDADSDDNVDGENGDADENDFIKQNGAQNANSVNNNSNVHSQTNDDKIEGGQSDDDDGSQRISYTAHLGDKTDELTRIKLRFINADEAEEEVQLRWPSDTKIKVLHLYIGEKFPHIPKNGYRLLCAFPRRLLTDDSNRTLKECKLHPSANLHLNVDEV